MTYIERRQRETDRQLVRAYALQSVTNEFYGRHEVADAYRQLAKEINGDILARYPQKRTDHVKPNHMAKRLNDIYASVECVDLYDPEFKAQKPVKSFLPAKVTILSF